MKQFNIAIDGPAGAGKSTIARLVAKKLSFIYIDTGAMYRAITLKVIVAGIEVTDLAAIQELVEQTDIRLSYDTQGNQQVFLDQHEVTMDIRSPKVTNLVSQIAALPFVREALVKLQRKMAEAGGVVMDGRDIGSYVLPKADFKFFLTASVEERAKRRYAEMQASGYAVDLTQLKQEIAERDQKDRQRAFAPLVQAPDALLIDSTEMDIDQVVAVILQRCCGR